MSHHLGIGLLLHCCVLTAMASSSPGTLELSGNDWRIHDDAKGTGVQEQYFGADTASWLPASVPGNIQSDLEASHQLKPLWYGAGDKRLYDVACKDWWYRKDFSVPSSFAQQRLTLIFDGVDGEAQVWLNGKSLGSHGSMFRRFEFDVTDAVKSGQINRLALRITRMPQSLAQWVIDSDGPASGPPYMAGNYRTLSTLKDLKSPTNWGWDWGVNIWTLGIWKDVKLVATGPARIDSTRVETQLSEDQASAKVLATLEIDSTSEQPAKARFQIKTSGQGPDVELTVDAALKKGLNIIKAQVPLDHPQLWWPNGQGQQPLYTLSSQVSDAGGKIMDQAQTRFGVRDLRWEHTQGAPKDHISRYQLIINGRPVRTMGSCLIPPDLLFGRMTPRTHHLLRQAKAAGMNTLRVWGGGVILHESVYDLADELGIMLLQEIPIANAIPEKAPEMLSNLQATVRNLVRQVRNHPAIVEFSGGNEITWNSATKHPALELMREIVQEESGRLFRATCPDLGATHGPWYFYPRAATTWGDTVPTMRAGEFGSSSPANLEVWHREIPPKDQWPIVGVTNPVLVRKNVVEAVFSRDHWLRKAFLDDVFGPFENLDQMVEGGQYFGAELLRTAVDGLRRQGRRVGGFSNWDFNEPWPNGAGSYLVDYDGRPLMTFDFLKQALAPVSLSLKFNSLFYAYDKGFKAELCLTSDAPEPAGDLRWKWLARDRRGTVFAHQEGNTSIKPLEVKTLDSFSVKPPAQTALGPVFVELRLENAAGKIISERVHIFGVDGVHAPLAQLIKNRAADPDDDAVRLDLPYERPNSSQSLIRSLAAKGGKPTPQGPFNLKLPVNDGTFGQDYSWSGSQFEVQLKDKTRLGRFKFGRDRTGVMSDRSTDYMKIETSLDGQSWQTVFEHHELTKLPDFSAARSLEVQIAPVEAQYLKVTVMEPGSDGKVPPVIDEFEAYAPKKILPPQLPCVTVLPRPDVGRPLRRTSLEVEALPMRLEKNQEVLELQVRNTGAMTAFPCEIHPLIAYRTDLFIDNNHCFIPPGESRTITIRADKNSACSLSLAQTGWWLSSWNAESVQVEASPEVLLSVGRRDQMCREYQGYFEPASIPASKSVSGRRPDASQIPCRLEGQVRVTMEFSADEEAARQGAKLRLHTADQSSDCATRVSLKVNGKSYEQTLPVGLGIQKSDPAHLAFPATVEFTIPAGVLRSEKNRVEIQVANEGWFTWDALECLSVK